MLTFSYFNVNQVFHFVFISFAAFCIVAIGDLFYITPLNSNRQHLFIKIFNLISSYSFSSR
ncbi:hypothetical protein DZB83_31170 [Bacillus sp. dmp10]|nr:hypothetical protein DZB83_31170 [Bacillus sp. dmp10]RFB67279.1 hypothetical protein DZB94_30260 [Bacillus sp. AW]